MATPAVEALQRLEESTFHAHLIQLETLRSILERNAGVGYLQPFLGGGRLPDPAHADPGEIAAAFRSLVPVSSYDDYADLIERIADGVESPTALSFDPLVCFFNSSGTSTTKPKLIPFFDSAPAQSATRLAHQASTAVLQRLCPPRTSATKILWFLYAGNVTKTRAGFQVMAATAYSFQTKSPKPSPLLSMCVSPREVITASNTHQQMYCHLLCGLKHSDSIDCIRAPYAAGLIRAIRMLESKWMQLCDDIEAGSVSSDITEPSMRNSVEQLLGAPQPDLASSIREICMRKNWNGILHLLWPQLRYIACVSTGSMEHYFPILQHYAGEAVPLFGGDYFSSECSIGINMDRARPPELTSYMILPSSAYFEFIPFDLAAPPKMKFITRAPRGTAEIITERDLIAAVSNFELLIGIKDGQVMEFAGYLDPHLDQQHVIMFVELNQDCMLLQRVCMEESIASLMRASQPLEACLGSIYEGKRANGDIGPLEISIVKAGSFDGLAGAAMERGTSANQYKPVCKGAVKDE